MKIVRINTLITLDDVAARDKQRNVEAWILWMCEKAIAAGKFRAPWDGKSIEGEAVLAFVNNGRWGARCKVCSNPQYVSHKTPIFFCVECGNGGSRAAWPVKFPDELERIEAALLKREVAVDEERMIRNEVELAFAARAVKGGLARSWRAGISVEQLEDENKQQEGVRR